eukprot:scaffold293322_cov51-Prasinocladus_malaysianus.AAC.1
MALSVLCRASCAVARATSVSSTGNPAKAGRVEAISRCQIRTKAAIYAGKSRQRHITKHDEVVLARAIEASE